MKKVYVLWNNIINFRIKVLKTFDVGNRNSVKIKILKKFLKKQKTLLKLISEGNHTNKGKSSLTSLVACFILGKWNFKAI